MMNDAKRAIAEKILVTVYEAWANHTTASLNPIRANSGLEDGVFHAVVEELQRRGLIKESGSFYSYELTATGVFYVEDNGLVPVDIAEKHRQLRSAILRALVDLYEDKGSLADLSVKELSAAAGVNPVDIYLDLSLLNEMAYIRDTSSNTYQITDQGFSFVRGGDHVDFL